MLILILLLSITISSCMVGFHLGDDNISGSIGWLLLAIVLLISLMITIERK